MRGSILDGSPGVRVLEGEPRYSAAWLNDTPETIDAMAALERAREAWAATSAQMELELPAADPSPRQAA